MGGQGRLKDVLWRIFPGGTTALAVAILFKLGAWQPLEQLAYIGLFNLRGPLTWDERVVVVGIDNASLQALGAFPWSRKYYAQLLNQLSQAEPSVVAFDLIWSDTSPDDPALETAILNQGRVVLAEAPGFAGMVLRPNSRLESVASTTGHILRDDSTDGVTRYILPSVQDIPALGIAAIEVYGLVEAPIALPDLNKRLWINWYGSTQQIPHYSFIDVLHGKVPAEKLRNKIVLVGVTADGIDPLLTPFHQKPSSSGVYLHATVVSNLLQGTSLQVVAEGWLLIILLFWGPAFSLILSCCRPGLQVLLWLASCLSWMLFCGILFHANYWLMMASPIALITGTTAVTLVSERLRISSLLRHQVKQLLQMYYPDVVQNSETSLFGLERINQQPQSMQPVFQLAALADQFGRSQSAQAVIARSLSTGLLAADLDGKVWFCNPVAAHHLQLQVGNLLQTHLVPNWLSEREWQTDLDQLKSGETVNTRKLYRDGSWLEMKVEPLLYQPTHQLDGFLLVLNDITERQQIEQMKSDFVAMASHELRTPLTSMRGSLGLLMTGKLGTFSDKGQRMLEIATGNIDRLLRLVNDILDLERIESGEITLSPQVCNLADVMTQAVEIMQAMADKADVELVLTPIVMQTWADPDCLLQVLTNLISNAIKFSPAGGKVWLRAKQLSAMTDSDEDLNNVSKDQDFVISSLLKHSTGSILLWVEDQGRGIPADKLERVFDRFQQVDVSDARQKGGSGLGLAICRSIVQKHGGTIWVESTVGKGSSFYLLIPTMPHKSDGTTSSFVENNISKL
ncbi:CHASE2 domain-containing protein [Leptolyngbya sp. FACHB-16]|uniref:CHASE2 domain-containing protein n=1 Tax=unclassified Leptolyngbya TaxID=2650499 RepID=UPI001682B132|nr:CHASE2 domain-containing protein [Leptolyngbya sp. FACHB-16]MBD2155633.1 CHASE2 domain-containing protein [Leptolyngbya sp. FACHB-16]